MALSRGRRMLGANILGSGASVSYLPSDTTGLQLALDYRIGLKKSVGGDPATLANDEIGYWEDQSGQGNHFSQTTMADKLTLESDGGLLVPRADGISDYLDVISLLSAGGTSARTLFMLAKAMTVPNSTELMFCINHDDGGAGSGKAFSITGEIAVRTYGYIEVYDTALSQANYQAVTVRNPASANVSDAQAWLDGSELSVSTITDGAINVLGTKTALAKIESSFANIRIKAIWFYNVEKSDVERAAIETEMALIP